MDAQNYYENLTAAVGSLADAEGQFSSSAFTQYCTELLTEAGEFDDVFTLDFEGTGEHQRKLKINGYDLQNPDNSIALIATVHSGAPKLQSVSATEAKNTLKALQFFLSEALDGSFLKDREESSPAYQLAHDLRYRGTNVSRFRLYLITDGRLSERLHELPTASIRGIPVDFHLWDIERFLQLHVSQTGRESLRIDLAQWSQNGLPALRIESTKNFATYLASVPGNLLSSLYGKFGSRLLESNVRSYLTNRGKVNRGIRQTIYSAPENFMAFNNGVTATATSVETDEKGAAILTIDDLQIVNGGQTTASLFFVEKESKDKSVLEEVHVPMKLVVVEPETASDLVPNISRFANSQNAVSAADFFSNSPYHVRIEELSRRVLAPAIAGATYNTKWYYERTRGQYENEKNQHSKADAKRFEKLYPKNQKFDKPALAKYIMSWEQQPHTVSAGAQKNFIAFAELAAKAWEKDEASINEAYFKDSVAKAILFSSMRTAISKAGWYERAYLANITTYTIAKIAHIVTTQGRGRLMNFDLIWSAQAVPQPALDVGLTIAEQVQTVLTDSHRLVQNVTEWAKKPECWERVQSIPISLDPDFLAMLADPSSKARKQLIAKETQKLDNGINQQRRILEISTEHWVELREFAIGNRVGSPTDLSILDLVTGRKNGFPSEKQSARLLNLVAAANAKGFHTFSP